MTAPGRLDLLLANVAWLVLCVLAFRFPVLTALGVVAAWDLVLLLSRRAPSLLPGPRDPRPWTDPDRLRERDFLELLAANGVFALGVLYLAISGIGTESQEAPLRFGAVLALAHFFVGFALLLTGITYGVLKAGALRDQPASDGARIADVVLDQAAALAVVVFLAFALQLLPAIVPVAAPLGALGFLGTVGLSVWIRRRGRYPNARAQALGLLRSLLTAPFVAMVLMFFLASPVRTHFLMDIGYEMHFMFAAWVLVPVLATPLLAARDGVRAALKSALRTVATLALGVALFVAGWFLSQAVDLMPVYEALLPPAQR